MSTQGEAVEMANEQERRTKENLKNVKRRIVVFSGKGGVGKTTVAVNLASTLSKKGSAVGLLDADITGPDVPKMIGLQEQPVAMPNERIYPAEQDGLKVISMATFIPADSPVIWRGPLRSRALDQFLTDVDWGVLDYLVADLPPGTGDEVMTMAQRMEPGMAIIVTTPQEMSLIDCRRAINMARKMEIPRIGVVENMSAFRCPQCGHLLELFGSGGGERIARDFNVDFLGRIPLDPKTRESADRGIPVARAGAGSDVARSFAAIASRIEELLD